MRSAYLLVSAILFAGTAHAASLTYDAALQLAGHSAPSLEGKQDDVGAARSAAIASGRLPDPKLSFGVEGFPVSGPYAGHPERDDFSDVRVGFSQDVPSGAKRRAERERASADIGVAEVSGAVEVRTVRLNTALAWIDFYFAKRRLAALDELGKSLADLRKSSPAQVASGAERPAQTLEPERLTAVLGDRRAELVAAIGKARAQLIQWTGDPDADVAGDPPEYALDATTLRSGLDRLPSLRAYDAMSRQADADVDMAKADKNPDWSYELAYQRRDPAFGDMIMGQVSVSLPLFGSTRQDPIISARSQTASRVRIDREVARRAAVAELESDLADHAMHHDRLARSETTLVPLADQRAKLETSSYAAGNASLSDVLEALLGLAEAKIDRLDREADVVRDGARIFLTYGSDPA